MSRTPDREAEELGRLVRLHMRDGVARQLFADLSRSRAAEKDAGLKAATQRIIAALDATDPVDYTPPGPRPASAWPSAKKQEG